MYKNILLLSVWSLCVFVVPILSAVPQTALGQEEDPVPVEFGEVLKTPQRGLIETVQTRMVKVYGASGFIGITAWQTGFLVSEDGLIVTSFTAAIDTQDLQVVLNDGSRYTARLKNADPTSEVALLKIVRPQKRGEASNAANSDSRKSDKNSGGKSNDGSNGKDGKNQPEGTEREVAPDFKTPAWDLAEQAKLQQRSHENRRMAGVPIYTITNEFGLAVGGEPLSVDAGIIAAELDLSKASQSIEYRYRDKIYLLDTVTSNPCQPGGAIIHARDGRLLGMVTKSAVDPGTGQTLNFALPIEALETCVKTLQEGEITISRDRSEPKKAWSEQKLGLVLFPRVVDKTPAYVDCVVSGSEAEKIGVQPNDLILYVNGRLVQSADDVRSELAFTDQADPISVTVERNSAILELPVPVQPESSDSSKEGEKK